MMVRAWSLSDVSAMVAVLLNAKLGDYGVVDLVATSPHLSRHQVRGHYLRPVLPTLCLSDWVGDGIEVCSTPCPWLPFQFWNFAIPSV